MNQDITQTLKTVYTAIEKSLDHSLFEPHTQDENEFAIQNVAVAFDAPNFLAVTVEGKKYLCGDKMNFIEDMRMHFADNPKFVIDGMFEYRLVSSPPAIAFSIPDRYKDKTFAEIFDSL